MMPHGSADCVTSIYCWRSWEWYSAEDKVSSWCISCYSESVDSRVYLHTPLHKNRTISFIFLCWEEFWCTVWVYLKNTVVIFHEIKLLYHVATPPQSVWWEETVSQSAHTENDAASLPTSPPLRLLWNACQKTTCVWGDFLKINTTWHMSGTQYLALLLFLSGK